MSTVLIPRLIAPKIAVLRKGFPAVAITGPRQSGKTTLALLACPELQHVNFESPVERVEFQRDPLGFLARFPDGAILDEVQNVPDLLPHLQVRIDVDLRAGRQLGQWILTGSRPLELGRGVKQSLAGRVASLELLPLSFAELADSPRRPATLAEAVLVGGYPPIFDTARELQPHRWLESYLSTFVERDVRQVLDVRDREAFDRFLRHCAARTGQILNVAELARDCSVDNKTIQAWIAVLEACYVIRLLRPHHRNFGKRLIKRPKLYFLDSGLACRLLHIADVNQLRANPLWGCLVETWCFSEVLKSRLNRDVPPALWFWRSKDSVEVDLIVEKSDHLVPVEIKSNATPSSDLASGIRKLRGIAENSDSKIDNGMVIYGGSEDRPSVPDRFVSWTNIDAAMQSLEEQ